MKEEKKEISNIKNILMIVEKKKEIDVTKDMKMKGKISILKIMTIKEKIKVNIQNLTTQKQMKLFMKNIK